MLSFKRDQNNIIQDRFDNTLFNDLLKASGTLKDVMTTPPIANEPWKAIVKDVWAGYYKFNPELNPEENLNPAYQANRPFIEKFLDDPSTAQTRIYTTLDELSAGIAAIGTAQKLNEEISNRPELKEKFDQFYNEVKKAGPEGIGAEAVQNIKNDLEASARDMRRAIREAAEAGQKASENLNVNLKGWGMEPGDLKHMPMKSRLELANYLSSTRNMQDLARIIGRFRNLARSRQKAKVKEKRDDIHSISIGDDLAHVLPAELATLNNPILKKDFYRRLTEKSLLQYDLKAPQPKGQGPIVGIIDISGSMDDPNGNPLRVAIATALALVDTATRQKRKAYLIFFNNEIKKEVEFIGKPEPEKFFEIAKIGASGGTDFLKPLTRGLEIIQESSYKKADMVFITDGIASLEEDFITKFNQVKEEKGFKVYSVLLGIQNEEFKKWSDKIWATGKVMDEGAAGEIFEEIF